MPVRWQLLGKAVNQTHCGCLEFFEPRGQWWFGGDESGGIHLHPRGIESLWLLTLPCFCCGREEWTLEAYDSHERLILTLRAGNRSEEEEWRSLLLQLFPADAGEIG
jgi:putative heme degradation protein